MAKVLVIHTPMFNEKLVPEKSKNVQNRKINIPQKR